MQLLRCSSPQICKGRFKNCVFSYPIPKCLFPLLQATSEPRGAPSKLQYSELECVEAEEIINFNFSGSTLSYLTCLNLDLK